ncbi:E3 ubiquitin-protein ligase MSL2 isoform X3 [Dermacentor albipictus]|uniref:E3 ubiquitin-protein ligase MSL2 isoform X3 n=1 Tax=Dermacentor albipictus TaxID=60249 RepID=UPI0031FC62F1
MNALNLYLETCRKVFGSDLEDHSAWADIYRLLSLLRQALACSVCSNLLVVPMSSSSSKCRHAVCKGCIGQTMRLSAPCVDCNNNTSGFTENLQLRIVLQCYKKICRYLSAPSFQRKWGSLNGGTNITFRDLVVEGSHLADNYRHADPASTSLPSTSSAVPSLAASSSFSPSLSSSCAAAASTTVPTQPSRVVNRTSAVAAAAVTKSVNGDRTRRAVLLNGDALALAHDRAISAPYKLIKVPAGRRPTAAAGKYPAAPCLVVCYVKTTIGHCAAVRQKGRSHRNTGDHPIRFGFDVGVGVRQPFGGGAPDANRCAALPAASDDVGTPGLSVWRGEPESGQADVLRPTVPLLRGRR